MPTIFTGLLSVYLCIIYVVNPLGYFDLVLQKQAAALTKLANHVIELINSARDDWLASERSGMPPTYSMAETHELVTALFSGKPFRPPPLMSMSRPSSQPSTPASSSQGEFAKHVAWIEKELRGDFETKEDEIQIIWEGKLGCSTEDRLKIPVCNSDCFLDLNPIKSHGVPTHCSFKGKGKGLPVVRKLFDLPIILKKRGNVSNAKKLSCSQTNKEIEVVDLVDDCDNPNEPNAKKPSCSQTDKEIEVIDLVDDCDDAKEPKAKKPSCSQTNKEIEVIDLADDCDDPKEPEAKKPRCSPTNKEIIVIDLVDDCDDPIEPKAKKPRCSQTNKEIEVIDLVDDDD